LLGEIPCNRWNLYVPNSAFRLIWIDVSLPRCS